MNSYPPFFGDGPRNDFLGYHYGGPSALGWTVFALQLVIVLGIVWLVASLLLGGGLGRRPAVAAAGPVLPPRAGDDALAVLRMRYAKGEIERDQYLQATTDLGGEAETEPEAEPPPPPAS